MPGRFFSTGTSKETMDRYLLIASEFGFYPPEDMPLYRFQQLSEEAYLRREKRIEAARDGKNYIG